MNRSCHPLSPPSLTHVVKECTAFIMHSCLEQSRISMRNLGASLHLGAGLCPHPGALWAGKEAGGLTETPTHPCPGPHGHRAPHTLRSPTGSSPKARLPRKCHLGVRGRLTLVPIRLDFLRCYFWGGISPQVEGLWQLGEYWLSCFVFHSYSY